MITDLKSMCFLFESSIVFFDIIPEEDELIQGLSWRNKLRCFYVTWVLFSAQNVQYVGYLLSRPKNAIS